MTPQAPLPKVYEAIVAVIADLSSIGIAKDRTATVGKQGTYKFRGIDDVYNALAPSLALNKLVILPRVLSRSVTERALSSGGVLFYVILDVEYDLISAEDGSRHTVRVIGEAMDSGDKASNKAMSAAYKYMAFQSFAIPVTGQDSEDDAHEAIAAYSARIARVAKACITKHVSGDGWGCYEEAAQITDSEEKLQLWDLLRDHSAVRSTIKEYADLERQKEAS